MFELGRVFRNEGTPPLCCRGSPHRGAHPCAAAAAPRAGITTTHNPEFTMCEAYAAFADAESLMAMTEELLREVRVRSS